MDKFKLLLMQFLSKIIQPSNNLDFIKKKKGFYGGLDEGKIKNIIETQKN